MWNELEAAKQTITIKINTLLNETNRTARVENMKRCEVAFQCLKTNEVTIIDDWLSKRDTLLLQQQNECGLYLAAFLVNNSNRARNNDYDVYYWI